MTKEERKKQVDYSTNLPLDDYLFLPRMINTMQDENKREKILAADLAILRLEHFKRIIEKE